MSQENVEIVRGAMARFSAGDYEGTLEAIAEDAVWEPSGRFVGSSERYSGHDGIRRFWAEFTEPWNEFRMEAVQFDELGDALVLTDTHFEGVGRTSSVPIEMHVVHLWTVRDRKITRFQSFASRAEALEAADMSQ